MSRYIVGIDLKIWSQRLPRCATRTLVCAGRHLVRGTCCRQRHVSRCLSLSKEHGFRQWLGLSRAIRSICMSMLEPSPSSLEDAKEELEEYCAAGYQLGVTVLHVLRSQALLLNRRPEIALEAIEQGLLTADRNNECILVAELCRLKACAVLDYAAPQARVNAHPWLERALATARSQCARSLELRAARDLAALHFGAGRRDEAHHILAPVYAWFTEGAGTNDLRSAKALLDQL